MDEGSTLPPAAPAAAASAQQAVVPPQKRSPQVSDSIRSCICTDR